MLQTLLSIHVVTAIMAFGPIFTFPILGMLAQKNPDAEHVLAIAFKKISQGMAVPIGLVQGFTGLLLIVNLNLNLSKNPWLGSGIILYLAAISASLFHQLPAGKRVMNLTAPGGDVAANRAEITVLTKRMRLVSIAILLDIIVIAVLMVTKPGYTA